MLRPDGELTAVIRVRWGGHFEVRDPAGVPLCFAHRRAVISTYDVTRPGGDLLLTTRLRQLRPTLVHMADGREYRLLARRGGRLSLVDDADRPVVEASLTGPGAAGGPGTRGSATGPGPAEPTGMVAEVVRDELELPEVVAVLQAHRTFAAEVAGRE